MHSQHTRNTPHTISTQQPRCILQSAGTARAVLPSPPHPHHIHPLRADLFEGGKERWRSPRLQKTPLIRATPCGKASHSGSAAGLRSRGGKAPISSSRSCMFPLFFFFFFSSEQTARTTAAEPAGKSGMLVRSCGSAFRSRASRQKSFQPRQTGSAERKTHTASRNPEMRVELPAAHADGRKKNQHLFLRVGLRQWRSGSCRYPFSPVDHSFSRRTDALFCCLRRGCPNNQGCVVRHHARLALPCPALLGGCGGAWLPCAKWKIKIGTMGKSKGPAQPPPPNPALGPITART